MSLASLINTVTRPESRTCVDHIWCAHLERMINTRTLNFTSNLTQENHRTIFYRDFKNLDRKTLDAALRDPPWDCAFVVEATIVISTTQFINSFKVACIRYAAFTYPIRENLCTICSDKKSLKLGMDVNDVVYAWYEIFNVVENEYFPLKQKGVKRSIQPK